MIFQLYRKEETVVDIIAELRELCVENNPVMEAFFWRQESKMDKFLK